MFAIVLRHNSTVGTTPHGVLIVHETNEPVLVGTTPLSALLLQKYRNGFKMVVYDRAFNKRREKVISPKNFDAFITLGTDYFTHANMTIERINYTEDESRIIEIDGFVYKLKEIR
jgi:hypothetical protein